MDYLEKNKKSLHTYMVMIFFKNRIILINKKMMGTPGEMNAHIYKICLLALPTHR